MNLLAKIALPLLALLAATSHVSAQCPLKEGDRVVFVGETMTWQGLYTRFVMNYFAMRYPGKKIEFRNAGVWNEMAVDGAARFQKDVLDVKPTVVVIVYGRGDGGFADFQQGFYDRYMNAIGGMVSQLKKANVRTVLLTPPAMDPDRNPALFNIYNKTLARYALAVGELAKKENLEFFNLHELMLDVQTKAKAKDPKYTLVNEGSEVDIQGHAVIAYAVLKAIGCKDQASGLSIDAAKSETTCDRCKVTDLKVQEESVTFSRFDEALPTYLHPRACTLLEFFPFTQDFNQYNFKVAGLKAGQWKLTVENTEVGTFSDKDLAAGVNLATLPGPWMKVGEQVDNAGCWQENLYRTQWQGVAKLEVPEKAKPQHQALLKKMIQVVQEQETKRIEAVPKNRNWKWSLTFIKDVK